MRPRKETRRGLAGEKAIEERGEAGARGGGDGEAVGAVMGAAHRGRVAEVTQRAAAASAADQPHSTALAARQPHSH